MRRLTRLLVMRRKERFTINSERRVLGNRRAEVTPEASPILTTSSASSLAVVWAEWEVEVDSSTSTWVAREWAEVEDLGNHDNPSTKTFLKTQMLRS